jgi:ATP-dependent RNA helicase DeaD
MTPEKLCEFMQEETGEKDLKIRDAEIFPHFSFVTVPFAQASTLLEIFKDKKRGRKPFIELAQKSKGRSSKNDGEYRGGSRNGSRNGSRSDSRSKNSTGNTRDTRNTKKKYSSS